MFYISNDVENYFSESMCDMHGALWNKFHQVSYLFRNFATIFLKVLGCD